MTPSGEISEKHKNNMLALALNAIDNENYSFYGDNFDPNSFQTAVPNGKKMNDIFNFNKVNKINTNDSVESILSLTGSIDQDNGSAIKSNMSKV